MPFLTGGVEKADALDQAKAQCTGDGVVDVSPISLLSLLDCAPATSVRNRDVLERFFDKASCRVCQCANENPVLPRHGQLSTAREFLACEAVSGSAPKFAPESISQFFVSEEDAANNEADGHLDKTDDGNSNSACGSVGPDHYFQLSTA